MEEKRKEIRSYLQNTVNPIIKPLVQEITKARPTDIMKFIFDYTTSRLNQTTTQPHSQSDNQESEQQKQFLKKLEEKKKKKMGKKTSRQGISAQVFGQFNKKQAFVPKIIPKSKQVQESIRKLMDKSILFTCLNKQDLNIVIGAMQQIPATPGQYIIKQGEKGDMLYIVATGQYDCTKVINGTETFLKTYKIGQSFGQLSLMYNAPRAATIKCKIPGKMYGLDRLTFTNIVQQAATKKRKHYHDVISKVQILAEIDPYEKQQICDALREEEFGAGQYVVKQGQSGDRFYIVVEGNLSAEKKETPTSQAKKVFEYKAGDYFGQIALVKNTVRQASIKAESDCRVVSIQRDAFKRLLGPIQQILSRNMEKYRKYLGN